MPKVKVNQETIFQYDGVLLFPEWNNVSKEDLEKLKTATLAVELGILEFDDDEPKRGRKSEKPE